MGYYTEEGSHSHNFIASTSSKLNTWWKKSTKGFAEITQGHAPWFINSSEQDIIGRRCRRTQSLTSDRVIMSKVWQPHPFTTRSIHPSNGPLGLRPMGIRYYGTIPNRTEIDEISGGRDWLLYKVGGSWTTRNNHWKEREGICVEDDHMQIRNP